ncbi:L-ascorbate oxidase homolog [Actinidia eriantha]|uniref:L-ascorbate oxidase homolog n=1 Tax=Actinidia eriantha TaxID=165200 RepID=UPI0025871D02|nr:L-ascorbate oxidase homolog [Actinidia eriantha]
MPLKLAHYFKIGVVFTVGSIPDSPTSAKVYLNTSVMGADYRAFVEVVFENRESICDVRMDGSGWSAASRHQYNLQDAVSLCTTGVYPSSWTAVYIPLDKVGMWNLRSEFWARQYLRQQFYLRIYTMSKSVRDEYPIPKNALLCCRAEGRAPSPI